MHLAKNALDSRGILNPQAVGRKFEMQRYWPTPGLDQFVERYWHIRWDLRGEAPHEQETLPYPCVNMVIEARCSRIYGVVSRKFVRRLEGQGQVLGIKFKPGGFYPFIESSVADLTDTSIPIGDVFGPASEQLEATVMAENEGHKMVEHVEAFLCVRLPQPDDNVRCVNQIIDGIMHNRSILKVDDVVAEFDLSKRSLQRLFRQYVGISPKWVIQRSRLQEAADQLATESGGDLPKMALELGYYDQAHFIKDFKAIIGSTPAEYARNAGL